MERASLYFSLAGNPVHKGHMSMIAIAIRRLKEKNIRIANVYLSLAHEAYLKNKIHYENQEIDQKNLNKNIKAPHKFMLDQQTRLKFLKSAMAEFQKDFLDVNICYWEDQDAVEKDHPDSYQQLAKSLSERLYFLAGSDLCLYMNNWGGLTGSIEHAVIITRAHLRPLIEETYSFGYSRFIFEGDAQYRDCSSTKIQLEGKFEYLPDSIREEFVRLQAEKQKGA